MQTTCPSKLQSLITLSAVTHPPLPWQHWTTRGSGKVVQDPSTTGPQPCWKGLGVISRKLSFKKVNWWNISSTKNGLLFENRPRKTKLSTNFISNCSFAFNAKTWIYWLLNRHTNGKLCCGFLFFLLSKWVGKVMPIKILWGSPIPQISNPDGLSRCQDHTFLHWRKGIKTTPQYLKRIKTLIN